MEKCLQELIKNFILLLVFITVLVVVIVWTDSEDSLDRGLWLQSTEQQLKEQNEQYYNELYDRYSKLQRDLIDYQKNTNNRIDILESRIESLESRFLQGITPSHTYINNNQVNGEG